jgi:hypothetical protein
MTIEQEKFVVSAEHPTIRRPRVVIRFWLILLLCYDIVITAIAAEFWQVMGDRSWEEGHVAALNLLGVNAIAGVVIAALALIATFAGQSGRTMADIAWGLAWLRLVAMPVVAVAVGAGFGFAGLGSGFILVQILLEVIAMVSCTTATRRWTRGRTGGA